MKLSKYQIINKMLIITLFLPLLFIYSCEDDPVGPEKGTIKGQIIDYLTNEPLEGCLVFTEPGTESVFSDDKGNFTINNVTPGEFSIKSAKVNYKTSITKISIRNNNTTISNLLMFVGEGTINLDNIIINQAPKRPSANYPLDESKIGISVPSELEISWNCTDPENDEMTYTVFLGQSSDKLNEVKTEIYDKKYKLKDLEIGKSYYWQVEAKDKFGNKTKSPIFSFETQNLPPTEPLAVYPSNNLKLKINNIKSINLSWSSNDPENGVLKYNVYFSDNLVSIPKIASDIKNSSYRVDNIEIQKTYFWKIEAIDDLGQKTTSQVFSFDIDTTGTSIDDNTPSITNGLLIYLGFNGNIQNFNDNYPCEINNVLLSSDRNGNANSAGSFNSINNSLTFKNLTDQFASYTVSFWIKPSQNYGYPYQNFVLLTGQHFGSGNSGLGIFLQSGKIYIQHSKQSNNYPVSTNYLIQEFVWSHISITYNSFSKQLKLYTNGNLISEYNLIDKNNTNILFAIGMDVYNNNRVFNGSIDEYYLFNRTLTENEIQILYNK